MKSIDGQVGRFDYNRSEGVFAYSLEANQLAMNGRSIGVGAFIGTVQGDFWSIEQATVGDLSLSADILKEPHSMEGQLLRRAFGRYFIGWVAGRYFFSTGRFLGQVNLFELSLSKLRDWKVTRALARKVPIKGELKGTGQVMIEAPLSDGRPWHAEIDLDTSVKGLSLDDIAFQDIDALKMALSEEGISFKNGRTAILQSQVYLHWSEIQVNPWVGSYAANKLDFRMPTTSVPWFFRILNKWQPRDWMAVQTFLSGWGPQLEGQLTIASVSSLTSARVQLKDGSYRVGGRSYLLRDTVIDYTA